MPSLPKPKHMPSLPPKPKHMPSLPSKPKHLPSLPPNPFGSARDSEMPPDPSDDLKVFYVNVIVHDASAAVHEQVARKMEEKQEKLPGNGRLKAKVADKVASLAASAVPDSKVAEKMSNKMVRLLPYRMRQRGLTALAERVFLDGRFFVLQLQVQRVNAARLAREARKDDHDDEDSISSEEIEREMARIEREDDEADAGGCADGDGTGYVEWLLSFIGIRLRSSLEDNYLPSLVQTRMSTVMGEMLRKKIDGKKIEAEAQVLPEEKQARYFFKSLKVLRQQY